MGSGGSALGSSVALSEQRFREHSVAVIQHCISAVKAEEARQLAKAFMNW
jgi:hypothetical protein